MKLYTIGYSGFPERDAFIAKLKEYGINAMIDVRSSPYSAHYEQYNKEELQSALKAGGIAYRNYAKEFGARQENLEYYRNGRLDFELFTQSEQFLEGFDRIFSNIDSYSFALMCAEKYPVSCHRAIMVARKFYEAGTEVVHILPHGEQSQADVEAELLEEYFPQRNQTSFFEEPESEDALLLEAYRLQNDKIGFKEANLFV